MTVNEMKQLSVADLNKELQELLKEQFNLRMLRGAGNDVASHQFRLGRKNIARIKTILHEKQSKKLTGEVN